jgi:tRNA(Ile)-lysidine synthase
MIPKSASRFSDTIMPTQNAISAQEAKSLFAKLADLPALVLAVSGGPDSTALLWLVARWRKSLKQKPALIAVTINHGLRPEAAREAAAVRRLAKTLGVLHRTMLWKGAKPAAGLQQAARKARYALLAEAAHKAGATHIITAHTLDDQAETVLIRMSRGSGLSGLAAMAQVSRLPNGAGHISLVRPLLDIPKARLVATLHAAKVGFADDPSNRDSRFTRARLRGLMPKLAREGLDAPRLSLLARRLKRADSAIEAMVERAGTNLADKAADTGSVAFPADKFARLPAEIALRLVGRAVTQFGVEGPVELRKLEALHAAIAAAQSGKTPLRRTLAGAIVTLAAGRLAVEKAPPRQRKALTTRQAGRAKRPEAR